MAHPISITVGDMTPAQILGRLPALPMCLMPEGVTQQSGPEATSSSGVEEMTHPISIPAADTIPISIVGRLLALPTRLMPEGSTRQSGPAVKWSSGAE